jgi:hypothetical protein
MLGIFATALLSDAVSVYIFHDVDKEKVGHLNEAFVGLVAEIILFTLVIGLGVALLAALGRKLLHLKSYRPHARLGLFLGIGITAMQYPWDYIGRAFFPSFADTFLSLYLVLAIVICSIFIVWDSFMRMKSSQAVELN